MRITRMVSPPAGKLDARSPRVLEILAEAKALAAEYYRLTGRPLGVTGEMAEFESARHLGLDLAADRQSEYDSIRREAGRDERLQSEDGRFGDRCAAISVAKPSARTS